MVLITEGAYNRNKIIILKQALAVHVDHIRFFIWGGLQVDGPLTRGAYKQEFTLHSKLGNIYLVTMLMLEL